MEPNWPSSKEKLVRDNHDFDMLAPEEASGDVFCLSGPGAPVALDRPRPCPNPDATGSRGNPPHLWKERPASALEIGSPSAPGFRKSTSYDCQRTDRRRHA